jgi:hypothetical protein
MMCIQPDNRFKPLTLHVLVRVFCYIHQDWDMAGPLSSRQATEVKALMQKDKEDY